MSTPPSLRLRAGALSALALAATAACSSISDPSPCDDGVCVQEVRVSALRRYLTVGDTTRLSAEVTSTGGAATSYAWRSLSPTIASVDDNGIVTARGLGRGTIVVVPSADTSLQAAVYFDVVSGDTAAAPIITDMLDPVTRSRILPGSNVGDSIDVTLEYVSGRNAGEAVQQVELRVVGAGGRDTTVTLTPATGTGILRSTARLRFGPPSAGAPRAFPLGIYSVQAITRLEGGDVFRTNVDGLFNVTR
ncbi:Ig-like domain-containing protein [Roseisolibacter sp. H3M3-2]|uniref:Ig-like domain-containing protein n=1 Tax=Roseisolibacter sp. H3M3-2 TaxID=3031323 RepID=UPI0023DB1599|nr:Ig-like domain-containing protein [Roseisolibacter sp. H3M3-2]MDF1503007.1 Ig-like domain-containing protein [Roseisolibacter sp. H3M3-2]